MSSTKKARGSNRPRVSITLSSSEEAEMQAFAAKHQAAKSWLGRRAIQEFFEKYRVEEMQLPFQLSRGDRQ